MIVLFFVNDNEVGLLFWLIIFYKWLVFVYWVKNVFVGKFVKIDID